MIHVNDTIIALLLNHLPSQWAFQDPELEVPTIYKAYVRAMEGNVPIDPLGK